jgi:ATP-binding cassette subfamily B protein
LFFQYTFLTENNKEDIKKNKKETNKKISKFQQKRVERKQKRLEKQQKKDFEHYGIKSEEIKRKSNKTNWKALGKCFKYFLPYKGLIALILLFSLLFVAISMVYPIFSEKMISAITENAFNTAIICAIIFAVARIVNNFVIYVWDLCSVKLTNKVTLNIRSDLIKNTFNTKTKKFDGINSGELIARIDGDSATLSGIVQIIIEYGADLLSSIAYIIYFFILNVWLGLIVVGIVIIFALLDTISQRYLHSINKKEKILLDKNIGIISEIVRAIRDIKALNIKKNINLKYQDNIKNLFTISNDRAKIGYLLIRIMWAVLAVAELGLIILAIYFASANIISLSVLIVFLMYKSGAISIVSAINVIRRRIKSTSLNAERICEILDENDYPKEQFGTKRIRKPQGKIEFQNVSFAYNDKAKVFEDFNLTISANKTVAFVGKSGSGKSTIINLILKLYEINSGKILIDDVDIKSLSESGLRNLVTIVPQTPYIFNTTIRENLALVNPDLTDEEMIKACKMAQIHDFIISTEKGYDSIVGESGVILSGGQKQRIAIARAFLKSSKIILLDEATSALDNESQEKIKEALDNLAGEHTIIIVAHRLSTIVDADEIVVINKGKIAGKGTHEQLMNNCVEYKQLYNKEHKKKKQ